MQSVYRELDERIKRFSSSLSGDDSQHSNYLPINNDDNQHYSNYLSINKGNSSDVKKETMNPNRNWFKVKKRINSIVLQDVVDETDDKEEIDDTSSIIFNLRECIIVIFLYLLVGVISFSFIFEHWSIGDSLYFTVVTLTTVGYGDFVPFTRTGKGFLCFFCLSGVALIGITLGEIVAYLIDIEQKAVDKVNRLRKYHMIGEVHETSDKDRVCDTRKEDDAVEKEIQMFWYHFFKIIFVRFLPVQVVLSVIAFFFVLNGRGDRTEVFYFLIVTSLSIGYGDITPSGATERVILSIVILISVGCMGDFVANVSYLVVRNRKLRKLQRLQSLEQFVKCMKKMDISGDDKVEMSEYFEYMLVCLGLVEKDLMDELRRSFTKMDQTKTGYISKNDLKIMHKKWLSSVRQKLELSRYKKHLKEISSSNLAGDCSNGDLHSIV